jgi:hypothetical protein
LAYKRSLAQAFRARTHTSRQRRSLIPPDPVDFRPFVRAPSRGTAAAKRTPAISHARAPQTRLRR